VVEAMRIDEMKHRDSAIALGAAELPAIAKAAMRVMAGVMTTVSHRI
jgi:ubiquinone biosynthesis monooxygenase Coq7